MEGSFDLVAANDPDIFAYVRQDGRESFLVLVNLSDKTRTLTMKQALLNKEYQYVFGNGERKKLTKKMHFEPYEALVFQGIG